MTTEKETEHERYRRLVRTASLQADTVEVREALLRDERGAWEKRAEVLLTHATCSLLGQARNLDGIEQAVVDQLLLEAMMANLGRTG